MMCKNKFTHMVTCLIISETKEYVKDFIVGVSQAKSYSSKLGGQFMVE